MMTVTRTVLLPLMAVLALGGMAQAQEWDDQQGGYVVVPGRGPDDGYYDRRPQYWRDEAPSYRSDGQLDDPYDYRDDPNGYYGDESGAPARRKRPQQRASIDPDTIAPDMDPGDKDDSQAALAQSPIHRSVVPFSGYEPGTVVISTREKRLYLVLDDGTAIKYGIGVGKQGFTWKGEEAISRKREWPDWTPPKEMIARRPELPDHMDGGLNNPLGARALYLGETLYRIHGTNEPNTIGKAVSSGCIRMANPDVMDLYNRVGVGTKVVVL